MDRIDETTSSRSTDTTPAEKPAGEVHGEPEPEAPRENRLPAASAVPEETPTSKQVLDALLAFYAGNERPPLAKRMPTPALLHPYRELTQVRHDYPACITDDGDVRPLSGIIEEVIATLDRDGDEGERLRRHVYRLEAEMRSLAVKNEATLTGLWDKASHSVLKKSVLAKKQKLILEENLAAARHALSVDGEIVDCGAEAPSRLFAAVNSRQWSRRCQDWCSELSTMIRELEDILSVDSSHSPQASTPEHLRSATGSPADELDFDAMSALLSNSHLGDPLPAGRRERIRNTLNMLRLVQPLFAGSDLGTDAPINADAVADTTAQALAQHGARMKIMADFFRAVRIGRIEIANGYRDAVHGPFFESFGAQALTEEELSLCPPVLLELPQNELSVEELGHLLALLGRGIPVKVLVTLTDLQGSNSLFDWARRLAGMAVSIGEAFVLQSTAAHLSYLENAIAEGNRFEGPALFCIYAGDRARQPDLPPYVVALTADESRVFPSFRYDPGQGETWLQRMDVSHNPQAESRWAVESFRFESADGSTAEIELPLTPADFFLCDQRLRDHFLIVHADMWHENMMPVHEYIELDAADATRKIPYTLCVTHDGEVVRAVVSRTIVTALLDAAANWRRVQELGGINNSFVAAAVSHEVDRLQREKDDEVKKLEERYRADLQRDIAKLTQEIVRRIASQLIADGSSATQPPPQVSAAPVEIPADAPPPQPRNQEAAAEQEAQTEDDDVVTLDDPYIDTPLCTSCNDCFKINDRVFAYDDNKQAYITDPALATYRELVMAAEACPVHIIHPGKPNNSAEPGLDQLVKRAERFM